MSRLEHPVSQEDLMAFVDGQLKAVEISKVSAHVETCPDCAAVVADAGQVSRQLAGWQVETLPDRVATAVLTELEATAGRFVPVGRKWWTVRPAVAYGLSGGVVAALLMVSIVAPSLLRSRQASRVLPMALPPPSESPSFERSHRLGESQQGQQSSAVSPSSPMVIRTIRLSLVTKEFDAVRKTVDRIVQQSQGYIDQLTVRADTGSARRLSATLRFPGNQVEFGLSDLKYLGRLTEESQNSSDITGQYVDLGARLSNARNSEQRLLRLLKERAGNLKDVVEMEREISSVRENIERMEAQQKDLNNKVQFATIHLELTEEYRAQLEPPAPSPGVQLRNALVDGIRSGAENALGIVLFLLRYGPVLLIWLIFIGPAAFVLWRWRASFAKQG